MPFCGSKAEIERYGDRRQSTRYACTECGCSLETGEERGHGKQWNRRTAPEGWKLVPVEPTAEMIDAGNSVQMVENGHWFRDYALKVYTKMVKEAPKREV